MQPKEAILINRASKNQPSVPPVVAAAGMPQPVGGKHHDNTGQDPVALAMLQQSLGHESALEILKSFLSFASEVIVELQDAIRGRREGDAHIALAELSNSCTVIGASSLLKGCIMMEQELENGDWTRVEHCMNGLVRETRCVGQFISELLSPAAAEPFSS